MAARVGIHIFEFLLLCHDQRTFGFFFEIFRCHRAVCPSSTNNDPGRILAVYDVVILFEINGSNLVVDEPGFHALQQPIIEFHPADGELIRPQLKVKILNPHLESVEVGDARGVFIGINCQVFQHLGGDPTGAGFETREFCLIQQEKIRASLLKFPRTRSPGRTRANNEHIRVDHRIPS